MLVYLSSAATALFAVYAFGYVTGSLFVDDRTSVSWSVIRVVSGLLLTTLMFLLSLLLPVAWYVGPAVLLAFVIVRRRTAAFALPKPQLSVRLDGVLAGALALVMVSPILFSSWHMAPGDFPPVFFSVDNAYFMEKVHALTTTSIYPPESLSNLGGSRSYHYAVHGIAALLSRISGLPPHQALFGIVVPLLAAAVVAAAVAAARTVAPVLPLTISVPLLLISVPTFWYSFWGEIITRFREASAQTLLGRLAAATESYEMWGVAAIEGHNVAAQFVVLAALAGVGTAASRGWRLPIFLIGGAIMVKTSVGVALVAGFLLMQAYKVFADRSLRPIGPALGVVAVFAVTYAAFWLVPALPSDFSPELFPLFHIGRVRERGEPIGLFLDVAWLFLPVLIVALARAGDPEKRSVPLLLLGLAAFVVVNLTRAIDERPGGGGATDDWLQILLTMTYVLHAFVLSFASARWVRMGGGLRTAFVLVMALTVLPAAWVAGRYAVVLVRDREQGHEFVDNRSLGQVLKLIPTEGTLIVTNDLRYPAQNFNRENRQMQIPALFGHQAFAVNYAYEVFEFSRDRRALQALLEAEQWSSEIDDAARTYGWTHLLIRKDYVHPVPIPLEQVFENESYAVYRF